MKNCSRTGSGVVNATAQGLMKEVGNGENEVETLQPVRRCDGAEEESGRSMAQCLICMGPWASPLLNGQCSESSRDTKTRGGRDRELPIGPAVDAIQDKS
jgi:hypothetical protein